MSLLKNIFTHVKVHFPAYIAIALIVVNSLIDSGTIHLSGGFLDVVNAVLAASGLGVLHARQQATN